MDLDSAVFYTNDIKKVIEFYRDVLGFKVEYIQDGRFVSFIFPNGAKLGIKQRVEEREIPGAQTVFIRVDDVEDLYEKLQFKVEIAKDLVEQDWGTNFSILDPDKNKVLFVEHKKEGK
jgi:predicted enzyme related to lactoylglutathione lyase